MPKRQPIRIGIVERANGKYVVSWGGGRDVKEYDSVKDAARALKAQLAQKHRRWAVDKAGTKPGLEGVTHKGRKAFRGYAVPLDKT